MVTIRGTVDDPGADVERTNRRRARHRPCAVRIRPAPLTGAGLVMTTIRGTVSDDVALSRRAGEYQLLSWVPDDEVPKAHRAIARRHLDRLTRRYGVGPLQLRFFGPPRPIGELREMPDGSLTDVGDFWARAPEDRSVPLGVAPDDQPDTVALHVGLRGSDLIAHTLAHEVRHVMQRRAGVQRDEADCDRFAEAYVWRLLKRRMAA